MLVIEMETQYRENYGTEEFPYWKNKFGETYVTEVSLEDAMNGSDKLQEIVNDFEKKRLLNNSMAIEFVVSWELTDSEYIQS